MQSVCLLPSWSDTETRINLPTLFDLQAYLKSLSFSFHSAVLPLEDESLLQASISPRKVFTPESPNLIQGIKPFLLSGTTHFTNFPEPSIENHLMIWGRLIPQVVELKFEKRWRLDVIWPLKMEIEQRKNFVAWSLCAYTLKFYVCSCDATWAELPIFQIL